jgi:iron complex outermembrane receptor protein
MNRLLTISSMASMAVALVSGPAMAQSQPAAPQQPAASGQGQATAPANDKALDDIIVTADRTGTEAVQVGSFRGAKIIDTPLTVSVITKDLLDSQQANGVIDALRNTPGVTVGQVSPAVYASLTIRGIPVDNRGNYRLNGSLPMIALADLPLEDKARVEALKGASALYYGFTPPSGIINLTTAKPTVDPYAQIDIKGNQYGQVQGHVDLSGTFGPLGIRTNFVYGSIENGYRNSTGSRSLESVSMELKPLDGLTMSLDVEHFQKEVTEPVVLSLNNNALSFTAVPKIPDMREIGRIGSAGAINKALETNVLGRIAYKVTPSFELTAEGGVSAAHRHRRFSSLDQFDPLTGNGLYVPSALDTQTYRNSNFRFEAAWKFSAGPIVHELLVGYSKNVRQQFSGRSIAFTDAASCTRFGLTQATINNETGCAQNAYNPLPVKYVILDGTNVYQADRDTSINDAGAYIFDRAKFGGPKGDLVSILFGVRKSWYKETQQGPNKTTVAPFTTYADNPISLSGGIVVKPLESLSVYGTYLEGLETGGCAPLLATVINGGACNAAAASTQYEGGVKWQLHPGLLLTGTYFDIKRGLSYLAPLTPAQGGFTQIYKGDGSSRYRGFEAAFTGNVTRDFSIYATALFLNAKQTAGDAAIIGKQVENTARTTWSLSGEYRFSSVLPGFALTAGAYYTGRQAVDAQNRLFLPAYTLFDLGGSYTFKLENKEMTARIYAQNITNKRYFAATGADIVSYGSPPVVKFSLSLKL